MTVLLIDDDPMVRKTGIKMTVFEARNGTEAIEIFRAHRDKIDCALCYPDMPGIDGWQTLTDLRKIDIGLPVVLVSGYDEVPAMKSAQAELPQVFLDKSYRLNKIKDAIARAMARQHREN